MERTSYKQLRTIKMQKRAMGIEERAETVEVEGRANEKKVSMREEGYPRPLAGTYIQP